MVKVIDDGVFPVSRAKVWDLIQAHQTDLQGIHPSVKSYKALNENTMEQVMDMGAGQTVKLVLRFNPKPPDQLQIDFVDGPMTGRMVNTYTEVEGGTKVVTEAEMQSRFMDEKQLETAIRDFLNNGFDDDTRYLKTKMK